jgi:hypothetical protein
VSEATDRLETLAWVYSPAELAVMLSWLRSADVSVFPMSARHISVQPALAVALGGVELRVRREDAPRARALLAGIEAGAFRGALFANNRLIEALVLLLLFFMFTLVGPARIPASFPTATAQPATRRHPE